MVVGGGGGWWWWVVAVAPSTASPASLWEKYEVVCKRW